MACRVGRSCSVSSKDVVYASEAGDDGSGGAGEGRGYKIVREDGGYIAPNVYAVRESEVTSENIRKLLKAFEGVGGEVDVEANRWILNGR
jgi:hypothetical protein